MKDILKAMDAYKIEIAKALNLSHCTIKNWTGKGHIPRRIYWDAICSITQIDPHEFAQFMAGTLEAQANRQASKQASKVEKPFIDYFHKKIDKEELSKETQKFFEKGGKIKILDPQPSAEGLMIGEEEDLLSLLI